MKICIIVSQIVFFFFFQKIYINEINIYIFIFFNYFINSFQFIIILYLFNYIINNHLIKKIFRKGNINLNLNFIN